MALLFLNTVSIYLYIYRGHSLKYQTRTKKKRVLARNFPPKVKTINNMVTFVQVTLKRKREISLFYEQSK